MAPKEFHWFSKLSYMWKDVEILKHNIDVFFLLTMGSFVFLMQCGFAFLEAGCVR